MNPICQYGVTGSLRDAWDTDGGLILSERFEFLERGITFELSEMD